MPDEIIPDDIRQFLLHQIDSVAHLEALLMLRTNPHKEWTAQIVASGLYLDESQVHVLLIRLAEQGFLVSTENDKISIYRYKPIAHELSEMADRIADLYKRYLVPITNILHSKSKNKIQEFANAFRIRKD